MVGSRMIPAVLCFRVYIIPSFCKKCNAIENKSNGSIPFLFNSSRLERHIYPGEAFSNLHLKLFRFS